MVLKTGFAWYGAPDEILTDHGSQFVSNQKTNTPHHAFGRFLEHYAIRHIIARRNHPQTNGKIERFFREIPWLIATGYTMDDVIDWQNSIQPHASLDNKVLDTVFVERLPPERIFSYTQRWLCERNKLETQHSRPFPKIFLKNDMRGPLIFVFVGIVLNLSL